MSEPTISLPVDLTNPGQFFACCGLLELASRLAEETEGWFEAGRFHLTHAPPDTIEQFLDCEVKALAEPAAGTEDDEGDSDDGGSKIVPLWVGTPFCFRLDWWRDAQATTVAKLKTWSAGQKVQDLFITPAPSKGKAGSSVRDHLREVVRQHPGDWIRETITAESPKPYCYDSRLSRRSLLDAGHSAFGRLAFSPACDVLCHVAFQRFRPRLVEQWTCNQYGVWNTPLPVTVAPAAVLGYLPNLLSHVYEFPIKPCDAAGRYKLIGHAHSARNPHV
jgi:hypothetical protein